jgi:hypothetical protein
MTWIAQNWIWILLAIAFVAMHLFGHGGHGGPGSQSDGCGDPSQAMSAKTEGTRPAASPSSSGLHHH